MNILNIGNIDRILRVVIGLIFLGLTITEVIGVWGYIGILPIVTGLLGFCPAYGLLGINTCKSK